jgi:DNA mismatch repair ATPase MutS
LEERQETLLAAIARDGERFGLAWLDLAAGRFTVSQSEGNLTLAAELERLKPAELLVPKASGNETPGPQRHLGGPGRRGISSWRAPRACSPTRWARST